MRKLKKTYTHAVSYNFYFRSEHEDWEDSIAHERDRIVSSLLNGIANGLGVFEGFDTCEEED